MKRAMMAMMAISTGAVGAPACDDDGGTKADATATDTSAGDTSVADVEDGETVEPPPAPIEVAGQWSSGFGDEWIWGTHWDGFCLQTITSYDNDDNVAVLETTGGTDCVNGFARVVWLEEDEGTFSYCTTAFGLATAAEAAAAPETDIDRGDLTDGCGGFPWSTLERRTIELLGEWTSGSGDQTITETSWDGFCQQLIARIDNDENVAVLETVGGEACGSGFDRVVWLQPSEDSFAYCTTAFARGNAELAWSAEEEDIDRESLETGCGGFPWSLFTRKP